MARLTRMTYRPLPGGGRLILAAGFADRAVGLLGVRSLPIGWALLIPGCRAVHTLGMRFAIDVAFVDGDGRVLRLVEGLGPWRGARCAGARAVVETSAAGAGVLGLEPGLSVGWWSLAAKPA